MYYVNVCGYACFVRNHGIKRTLNSWQSFDCSSIILIFLYNRLINRPLITEGYEFRRKNSEWIRSRHLSPHSRMWKTSIIVRWLYKTLEKLKISLDKIAFIQSFCNWNYNNLLLCLMWILVNKKKKKKFFFATNNIFDKILLSFECTKMRYISFFLAKIPTRVTTSHQMTSPWILLLIIY